MSIGSLLVGDTRHDVLARATPPPPFRPGRPADAANANGKNESALLPFYELFLLRWKEYNTYTCHTQSAPQLIISMCVKSNCQHVANADV